MIVLLCETETGKAPTHVEQYKKKKIDGKVKSFLAQTKGRRERERKRRRKGKEKEKGKLEVKLWQKRKNRKRKLWVSSIGVSIAYVLDSVLLRWLGTVVTSHTASNRQAYTPVMSMLQKAVQSTHCTSCNQPAHTNAIILCAVKSSLYVVGPFLCRILHKSWSTGVKKWQNCSLCQNEPGDIWFFFR